MEISDKEQLAIQRLALVFREYEQAHAARNGILREIRELTIEIIVLMGPFWPLLDECLCRLKQSCLLFDPLEAYRKGALCACAGKDYLTGLREYLVEYTALASRQEEAVSVCLAVVYRVLQRMQAAGLLTDLTTAYRMAYDNISRNAEFFFRAGYQR